MDTFKLTTERLYFSVWQDDDSQKAMDLWGDAQVSRFITTRGYMTIEEVGERLKKEILSQQRDNIQYWPLYLKEKDVFIGCCGLRTYDYEKGVLELGVHLKSEFWGKGYAREACTAVIDYAFDELGVSGLFAGHNPHNKASCKMLKQLGFQYTHDEYYEPTGLEHPSYIMKSRIWD